MAKKGGAIWRQSLAKRKAAKRKVNRTGRSAAPAKRKGKKKAKPEPRTFHALRWVRLAGGQDSFTHVAALPNGLLFREQYYDSYTPGRSVALQFVAMDDREQRDFWKDITVKVTPDED